MGPPVRDKMKIPKVVYAPLMFFGVPIGFMHGSWKLNTPYSEKRAKFTNYSYSVKITARICYRSSNGEVDLWNTKETPQSSEIIITKPWQIPEYIEHKYIQEL